MVISIQQKKCQQKVSLGLNYYKKSDSSDKNPIKKEDVSKLFSRMQLDNGKNSDFSIDVIKNEKKIIENKLKNCNSGDVQAYKNLGKTLDLILAANINRDKVVTKAEMNKFLAPKKTSCSYRTDDTPALSGENIKGFVPSSKAYETDDTPALSGGYLA